MKEVYDFLTRNVDFYESSYIVVAVSGGPDSMVLLKLLIDLKKKYNFNIVCAHVNHNVRKESEEEKVFLENYCKSNDVVFEYMKIKKYDKNNFHNQARIIRYNFFDDIVKKYNSKYLFTAHHGDDLTETILMRVTRGSTLKGYAGFSFISNRNKYNIVRPLLLLDKDNIKNYAISNDIPFVIDKSNDKEYYTRNRYRKHILPFLKSENENIHLKYLKFSEELLKYHDYVQKDVDFKFNELFKNNTLNLSDFKQLDLLIKEKLIEKILWFIYKNDLELITSKHINNIIELSNSTKANLSIVIPNNIVVSKIYDQLKFENKTTNFNDKYKHKLEKKIEIGNNIIEVVKESNDTSNYCIRLNSNDVRFPLYIRNRIDGDKIEIKGLNGSKKIKDIYINSKIPKNQRNQYPLLVDSDDKILWIPGIKKSKYDKSKEEKCDIIIKCNLIEEENDEKKQC